MADVTTQQLLDEMIGACANEPIVEAYAVRTCDRDILSLRIFLIDQTFIEIFYNVTTGKTSFALIAENVRIYGKDNTKIGWHVHPFSDPTAHAPCSPPYFVEFLQEVTAERFSH